MAEVCFKVIPKLRAECKFAPAALEGLSGSARPRPGQRVVPPSVSPRQCSLGNAGKVERLLQHNGRRCLRQRAGRWRRWRQYWRQYSQPSAARYIGGGVPGPLGRPCRADAGDAVAGGRHGHPDRQPGEVAKFANDLSCLNDLNSEVPWRCGADLPRRWPSNRRAASPPRRAPKPGPPARPQASCPPLTPLRKSNVSRSPCFKSAHALKAQTGPN